MSYTVRNRDTLTSIAQRFNTTPDALAQANGLADANKIRAGQQLRIPGKQDDFDETSTVSQVTQSARTRPAATVTPAANPITASPTSPVSASPNSPITAPATTPVTAPTTATTDTAGAAGAAANVTMQHRSIASELLTSPGQAIRDGVAAVRGQPFAGEAAPSNGQPATHVNTPYYVQTQGGHGFRPGKRQCFAAASAMATQAGGHVLPVNQRIEVATHKDRHAHLTVSPAGVAAGRNRIDSELNAGRPVVVGVAHNGRGHYNADKMTDHFVTITGRGTDAQGRQYYTFNDPGTRLGQDTRATNRFYVDPQSGNLYRPSSAMPGLSGQRYEVSMVR